MEDEQHYAEALALSSPLLLPFERKLVEEAIQDDCLIVTASGLGWQRVAAVLLRIAQHARMAGANPAQSQEKTAPPPIPSSDTPSDVDRNLSGLRGCVLVLGASPWQRTLITSELTRHDPNLPTPVDINNEVPAAERVLLYRAVPGGRPLFITPRILVVDLLARRLRGHDVAGVLLLNAHRVSDTSGEGFAVALLRGDSPAGAPGSCWVRALSDAPVAFNQGFNKVEKVMKALHVRRLHLWPRFQEHVRQCLDEHKPVVVEWDQELSGHMMLIQAAILEVLEALIQELKRTNNKLDASELVLENGVLRSFDEIVRRQLDPIWHTVSWKTRRICADLRTLRELSALLVSTDCVTFLAHLEGLRQSEGVRCVWLFHDATHAIYEQARRRVYVYRQQATAATSATAAAVAASTGDGGGGTLEVEAVLEEPPKWGLLVEVLREVQRQRRQLRAVRDLDPEILSAALAANRGTDGSTAVTTTAVAATSVEVVDLASGGSSGEDVGDEDEDTVGAVRTRRKARGTESRTLPGSGACGRSMKTAAATGIANSAPSSSSDVAADVQSLRALLEDLGLLASGAAEAAAEVDPRGAGGGGRADDTAIAATGTADGTAAAASVAAGVAFRRDLRLLADAGQGPVLVVARELHSAKLLERVVREGGRAIMQQLYDSYLLSKLQSAGGGRGGGGGWRRYRGGGHSGDTDDGGRGPVLRPGEHLALVAAAQRVGEEQGEPSAGARGRGRAAKRPKLSQQGASTAAGAAGSGTDSGRGRGRVGAGGSRRQRKPDDSPVRVAAAAAAAEEVAEEVDEEDEKIVAAAAVTAPRGSGRVRAGKGGGRDDRRGSKGRSAADRGGDGNVLDSEDDWADGATVRSRQPSPSQRGGRRGTAGRGRGNRGASSSGRGGGEATAGGNGKEAAVNMDGNSTGAFGNTASQPPPEALELLQGVHFISLDSHDEFVLWRLRPSFVIMYEPDLTCLRQVEMYQAERCLSGGCPLWLHILSYGQSLEQQRFRAAVERERDTMLRLIQAKQHLVLPTQAAPGSGTAGGRVPGNGAPGGGALSADLWLDVYSANALTRAAGGRAGAARAGVTSGGGGLVPGAPKRLVVDVREFMSSLPAVLYQKGFELLPVTLEVGDYVLSPELVVERKSIPDLHASLASGRLYNQAEVMCRHYARPLLLIEFDPDRQFGLQSSSELGNDIDPKNVISKLTLLTLHFPKLRLLWSRSPHATAELFAALKSNQEEPDPAAAALVGVPVGADGVPLPLQPGSASGMGSGAAGSGGGLGPGAALEAVVNQPAMELLRRLPGVNDSNYRAILGHVSSLAELASLPFERLEAIMASTKNARALRDFLDAPCPRI